MAERRGLEVSITIFDGRDFRATGPPGCNMCAGVVAETLVEKMDKFGVKLPENRVQMEIEEYVLSTEHYQLCLHKRKRRYPIYTVFRGNGPLGRTDPENVSFDDYLLDQCCARGIRVVSDTVTDINMPGDRNSPVSLVCKSQPGSFEAHLVVVACGLNTRLINKLGKLGFGYRPPPTVFTCQAEIPAPEDFIQQKIGRRITTFALGRGDVRFAAFTPKKSHLTVSVIGKSDVSLKDLELVLNHPRVRNEYLQGIELPETYCICRPKIAVGPGRNVFTDRLVVIGDAAFSRYYKNGIESAFDTARLAATCAIEQGVSTQAFGNHFLNQEAKTIISSSSYGRLLFHFYDLVFHSHLLTAVLVSLLSHRSKSFSVRQMTKVLWALFTGNIPYRDIFFKLFHPRLQARLVAETVLLIIRKLLFGIGALIADDMVRKEVDNLGPLGSGQVVAIIGGGPGGVGCAMALKNYSRDRWINLHVVIYEGKEFETQPHYNQCVGVLSPPIVEIIERELGLPFPYHLEQRKITGYVLHSDTQSLLLSGEEEPSTSVRRVTFDSYFLNQARMHGVEVITSRVTDIEIKDDGVMIYSETDNRRVDVVVGAFGLDDGTAKIFERATGYRQPRFLNSIVTKIHPGEDVVAEFGNHIHAFLPSVREIEFGAVTPKRNHLTINVAGANITSDSLHNFLKRPEVRSVLPPLKYWNPEKVSYFKGRFPIRVARGYYGDRYVVIGDAAGLLRPFKGKGVNTAILTGMRAARTMLEDGISIKAFDRFHAKCKDITDDLPYGKLMRFLTLRIANWKILDPILKLARTDTKLERALFNSVSAHRSFKTIFGDLFKVGRLLLILREVFIYKFRQLLGLPYALSSEPAKEVSEPQSIEK